MPALYATTREVGVIALVDLSGRIALGEGSALLRKTIRDLLDGGNNKILLNLATSTISTVQASANSLAGLPRCAAAGVN